MIETLPKLPQGLLFRINLAPFYLSLGSKVLFDPGRASILMAVFFPAVPSSVRCPGGAAG